MKSFRRKLQGALLFGALAAVILVGCFAAYPALTIREERKAAEYQGVLRLWQIDSFEGGKGSRASFLNRVARKFESQNEGIFILVTAHTPQSAALAASDGETPDMISFGTGTEFVADLAAVLPGCSFPYSKIGKDTVARPWCRGCYFLFTAEGDFSDVSAQNTVVSQGGSLSEIAAYCAGIRGEMCVESSVEAYVNLMKGKYKYMLGSQRDVYRFATRQFPVQAKPLAAFCDLWQYISICSADNSAFAASLAFLEILFSEEVQKTLPQIGMMSAEQSVYDSSEPAMQAGEQTRPERSVNAFLSEQAAADLRQLARAALGGDKNSAKNLENYLL